MLAGWAGAVARFREDANAEDDHALGGYRDRLVVELAQNAADAAARAGVPGRLRLALDGGQLRAANTGAPLDAAGVEGLATLRASDKRDGTTAGRFGVGFAAVLAVTDEPAVVSRTGAVRWSRELSGAAAEVIPALAGELARRGGAVPVLRLPFAWSDAPAPPEGFDTEVRLPLRDDSARGLATRLLGELDPTLLLALPALAEIEVVTEGAVRLLRAEREPDGDVVLVESGAATRWRTVGTEGRVAADLLADRPAEERARDTWSVTWAVPVDQDGRPLPLPASVPQVVRAPTVTDEPLGVPAVLVATFPLDPSRRHVAPGALCDFVAARAGEQYARLLSSLAPDPALLRLVPTGAAAGAVDSRVRAAALAVLPATPLLPAGAGGPRLAGRDAVVIDDAGGELTGLVALLAPVVDGLLPASWSGRAAAVALTALGATRLRLADVVELSARLVRPPSWWAQLYAALADAVPPGAARDALGALPVPLADGRLVTGPRGLVVPPADGGLPGGLDVLGVRVVHPDAVHPLLRSLGAVPARAEELLDDPRVRAAVETSYEADEPAPIAEAVLGLAAATGAAVGPGARPWLAELALPGDDGEWYPAGELLLPGGRLAGLVADDAPFGLADSALVERWGPDVLRAVGVLDTFAVVREPDAPVDPALADRHLDGEADWLAEIASGLPDADGPAVIAELVAVRDLELVETGFWADALRELAAPPLRAAVVEPARLLLPGGRAADVPAYTAWWLASHPVLAGRRPGHWAIGGLGGLYDSADAADSDLDAAFLAAIGIVSSLAEAVAADPAGVLDRLADPARAPARTAVREAYALLAAADPERFAPPERVRAVDAEGGLAVVDADRAVVVDAPDLLPLLAGRPHLPVSVGSAAALADALDLPLATELAGYEVRGRPARLAGWADLAGSGLAADRVGELPQTPVALYDELLVDDADGRRTAVSWRALPDADHVVAGDPATLGRALAWRCGRWGLRAALTEAFAAGGSSGARARLAAEDDLD